MAAESPFTPTGATVALSATGTSSQSAISGFPSTSGSGVMRVVNAGTAIAFIKWGSSAPTATTADMPILPGAIEVFSVGTTTNVAAITASGTATVYFTPGNGQ